jgi:hypothetical protein
MGKLHGKLELFMGKCGKIYGNPREMEIFNGFNGNIICKWRLAGKIHGTFLGTQWV